MILKMYLFGFCFKNLMFRKIFEIEMLFQLKLIRHFMRLVFII